MLVLGRVVQTTLSIALHASFPHPDWVVIHCMSLRNPPWPVHTPSTFSTAAPASLKALHRWSLSLDCVACSCYNKTFPPSNTARHRISWLTWHAMSYQLRHLRQYQLLSTDAR